MWGDGQKRLDELSDHDAALNPLLARGREEGKEDERKEEGNSKTAAQFLPQFQEGWQGVLQPKSSHQ